VRWFPLNVNYIENFAWENGSESEAGLLDDSE
jgi:hypothetical protein